MVNGIVTEPFLVITMFIDWDRELMGSNRTASLPPLRGCFTTAVMVPAGGFGLWSTVTGN